MDADSIARLKITLDYIKPVVLRRVDVPVAIRLDRLHLVIQAAMGWTDSHMYEFRVRDSAWGMPDPGWHDGRRSAAGTRLADVLASTGTKTLSYLYDFGDDWSHKIRVEQILPPTPGTLYPQLLAAAGRCPPEDIGGPPGYWEFLEAIGDPAHESHAELSEWYGGDFDPGDPGIDQLAADVAALAKPWARPAPKRRKAG